MSDSEETPFQRVNTKDPQKRKEKKRKDKYKSKARKKTLTKVLGVGVLHVAVQHLEQEVDVPGGKLQRLNLAQLVTGHRRYDFPEGGERLVQTLSPLSLPHVGHHPLVLYLLERRAAPSPDLAPRRRSVALRLGLGIDAARLSLPLHAAAPPRLVRTVAGRRGRRFRDLRHLHLLLVPLLLLLLFLHVGLVLHHLWLVLDRLHVVVALLGLLPGLLAAGGRVHLGRRCQIHALLVIPAVVRQKSRRIVVQTSVVLGLKLPQHLPVRMMLLLVPPLVAGVLVVHQVILLLVERLVMMMMMMDVMVILVSGQVPVLRRAAQVHQARRWRESAVVIRRVAGRTASAVWKSSAGVVVQKVIPLDPLRLEAHRLLRALHLCRTRFPRGSVKYLDHTDDRTSFKRHSHSVRSLFNWSSTDRHGGAVSSERNSWICGSRETWTVIIPWIIDLS